MVAIVLKRIATGQKSDLPRRWSANRGKSAAEVSFHEENKIGPAAVDAGAIDRHRGPACELQAADNELRIVSATT